MLPLQRFSSVYGCVLLTSWFVRSGSISLASQEEASNNELERLYASSEAFASAVELLPLSSNRDYGSDTGENAGASLGSPYENGHWPASESNYDGYGGDGRSPYGASGGYAGSGGNSYETHDNGHGGQGRGSRNGRNSRNGRQRANSGYYSEPVERSFKYERKNGPQQHRVSGNSPRSEYNNERGFTYERVYPEKVSSRSYKKDYVEPQRGHQPMKWQGGHDRSYSFSDRGEKNYTPRPVIKNYSSNYGGSMNSYPHGGGGNYGSGSPSVRTYDYVDPKAGSRTRLVEVVRGRGARNDVAKYLTQPGGIDRYMNNFMNGASSF